LTYNQSLFKINGNSYGVKP